MNPSEDRMVEIPAFRSRAGDESAAGGDQDRMAQALEEYRALLETGQRPDWREFLGRYADIAEALSECLAGLEFVHGAAPALSQDAPGGPTGAPVSSQDLCPALPLGDFRIVREVGRGGMGVVYEAVQLSLGRRVALKVLPFASTLDARHLQRFKNEAQAAAHLHHQNIVPVFATGCERGVHYYAMQFIDGHTLAALIADLRKQAGLDAVEAGASTGSGPSVAEELLLCREGREAAADLQRTTAYVASPPPRAPGSETLTPAAAGSSTERSVQNPAFFRTVARLGVQAAEALEHAHQLGVVHRDIKPANLLVDGRANLWITDFGLAHCQSQAGLTMTGDLVGTLRYMSPEQALAKRVVVDHRTDVYSLGATLYELLTLEPAFPGKDRQELLRQIAFEEPKPPRRLNRALPAELETIILKALEKNPAERYATAQELADDLERFLKDEPIRARRPTPVQRLRKFARRHKPVVVTAAVLGVVLVGLLAAFAIRESFVAAALGNALGNAREERDQKDRANKELATAIEDLEKEKRAVDEEKREAQINLSTFLMDKGLDFCEKGEVPLGLLWLARSLKEAPPGADDLQRAIRRNLATWPKEVSRLRAVLAHPGVRSVAFSSDGKTLLTVSANGKKQLNEQTSIDLGEVRRWDTATGEPIGTPVPHQGYLGNTPGSTGAVAVSADGRLAVVGEDNQMARLWDLDNGEPRGAPLPHAEEIRGAAFSADGRILLTHTPGTVCLWDTATAKAIGQPITVADVMSVVALSPDGHVVLTAAQNKPPQLWRAATGKPLGSPLPHPDNIVAAAFSPGGERVVTAGIYQVRVWEVSGGKSTNWRYAVNSAGRWALSPDIAVSYGNPNGKSEIRGIGPRAPGTPFCATLDDPDRVDAVAVSPDGFLVATSGGQTVRLWSVYGHSFGLPLQQPSRVTALAFSPDGEALVTACADGTVRVWDLAWPTGGDRWQLIGPREHASPDEYNLMALSADGKTLLRQLGGFGSFSQVWDVTTRKPRGSLLPVGSSSAVSPDGQKVLLYENGGTGSVAGPDGKPVNRTWPPQFWLWHAGKWTANDVPREVPPGWSSVMAFGPGAGTVLLTSPADGSARLWDLATWKPLGPPLAHPAGAGRLAVALGPDGRTAVTARGREARLWDCLTGQALGPPPLQHPGDVESVAFSPDGRTLATSSADRTARLWQVATGQPIGLPLRHTQGAMAVAFNAEGAAAATEPSPTDFTTAPSPAWDATSQSRVAFSPDGATVLTASAPTERSGGQVLFWDAHTGRPLGRPWPVGPVKSLAFTGDGTSALAATVFQVERWDVPPPPPQDEPARLMLWAEAITGRSLDAAGTGVWLSPEEWRQRRRLLEQGGPPVPPPDRLAWHRHGADVPRETAYFAALWHLDRLIAAEPGNWKHHSARAKLGPFYTWVDGKWQDTGSGPIIADYTQAIALGAEGSEAWERRALLYGRQGQWDKAAADYQEAVRRGAGDDVRCKRAQALWRAGQADAYRRVCADLLDRFAHTDDAALAHDVASVCLLDPKPQVDLERVTRLAEKGLTEPWHVASEDEFNHLHTQNVVNREREGREVLALALYRAGQFEAAIRGLSERTRQDRPRPFAASEPGPWQPHLLLLAMAHQRLGHPDQAQEYLVRAAAAPGAASYPGLRQEAEALVGVPPDLADAHYRAGLSLEEKKEWAEAIAQFREAIRLKPDHALAYQHLGNIGFQRKDFRGAIDPYRQALRLEPNNAEIRSRLASALNEWALIQAGVSDPARGAQPVSVQQAKWAVVSAKEAVALAPAEGNSWHTLGVAHYRAEEWKDALAALGKSMELRGGGDSFDWFFLAMAHGQLSEKESAGTWYDAAVLWMYKHRAGDEPLRRLALEAAELLRQPPLPGPAAILVFTPAEAAAIWTRVLKAKPDLRVALNERAEAYAGLAQWDKAAADYNKVIGPEPPNDAWFQLACVRLLAGDTEGYAQLRRQVRERAAGTKDPALAYIASRICMLSPQALTEPAQLVRWAGQAVASQPKSAGYLHTLGAAHYRAGEWDQAVQRCRESLEADLGWRGAALNWPVLAMAHHRLGHADEARQCLSKVGLWMVGQRGMHPPDSLEFTVLYREAEALLKEPAGGKSDKEPE
jgi:WD40 repeat protein/serine/threonine protein kinase/tetratricopeptide (TPR) repeat protein